MIRKKYAFALLFLQYVPAAVRDEKLAELLRRNTKQDLLASLEKLRYRGVIGLQFVNIKVLFVINKKITKFLCLRYRKWFSRVPNTLFINCFITGYGYLVGDIKTDVNLKLFST